MLSVGNAVYLLIPSASKRRILHRGQVIESNSTSFVAEFDEDIAPAVDSDVNAFCEVDGKFFQQGAVVTEIRPGTPAVIAFRRNGEPVSAENRQTYRVSLVAADFTARIGREHQCQVVDISPEGFAAITSSKLNLGSVVQTEVWGEGDSFSAPARVQTVQERDDGRFRYGFLVSRDHMAARKTMQQMSVTMQRLQLKRLRGVA
jgi:PilZ domain